MKIIYAKTIWNKIEEKITSQDNGDWVYLNYIREIFFRGDFSRRIEFAYLPVEKFKRDLLKRFEEDSEMETYQYLKEEVVDPVFVEIFETIKKNIEEAKKQ